jgi:hypothetical protein
MKGIGFYMLTSRKTIRYGYGALLAGALAILCLPAGALAHTGEFAKFNFCPSTTEGVHKCLYSVTGGGEIVLGKKTTPIVHPVTLQGGFGTPNEENVSSFYGATNGETLSKTQQEVPGGLLGIVPPESSPPLVKLLSKFFFENKLTGINAVLELAEPASEIKISTFNLLIEEGVALKLPVKVHLENPFLGSSCYVGSSSKPLIWNLTTGATSPPAGHASISGKAGFSSFKEGFEIAEITENELVENNWSTPEASGCGGVLSFLVDPVINSVIGLPSPAGVNVAKLKNTIYEATVGSVNAH